jgi:flagellar export protein FliJ
MPRFRFRFQPVLGQREREEQDRMLAVAALERERVALENRLRACQGRIVGGRAEISAALTGGRVDLGAARMQAGATLRDDQEARRTVLELAGVMKRLASSRAELARAASRRRAIELLRDRDLERFRTEENRREALDMDDLMVMRTRGES